MNIVGIGLDMEPIRSFRDRPFAKRRAFYERLFSKVEIDYCKSFHDPAPHFAARYCAKEALVKASRAFVPLHITDAEIHNNRDGAPSFRPRSKKGAILKFFRGYKALVSLSHTDDMATAFVVVTKLRKGKR